MSRRFSIANMSTVVQTTVSLSYDSVENLITCIICQCQFDSGEHQAKQLPCAHTVCLSCLHRIIQTAYPQAGASSSLLHSVIRQRISCPHCRTECDVPRGGPQHFPSGFVVNTLRDMIANQMREVVPKCPAHPNQDVLYCEPCAVAFCQLCSADAHKDNGLNTSNSPALVLTATGTLSNQPQLGKSMHHIVVNFQDALRRALGMLRYKVETRKRVLELGLANVSREMEKLDEATDRTVPVVNGLFGSVKQYVEDRQLAVIEQIRNTREQKCRLLEAQRSLIQKELNNVQSCYESAASLTDIAEITRRFVALCDDEKASGALEHPRENAFLQLDAQQFAKALHKVLSELNCLGTVRTSTAYPPLCQAVPLNTVEALFPFPDRSSNASQSSSSSLPSIPSSLTLASFWVSKVLITTFDYLHGTPLKTGGDPVRIELYETITLPGGTTREERIDDVLNALCDERVDLLSNGAATNANSSSNSDMPIPIVTRSRLVELVDYNSGFYEATFRPNRYGEFSMHIRLFDRPIKSSPIVFHVAPANTAVCTLLRVGRAGNDEGDGDFNLPNGVCVSPIQYAPTSAASFAIDAERINKLNDTNVYVLDSALSRIKVLKLRGDFVAHLKIDNPELSEDRAATGICASPCGSIWLVNWHSKYIGEIDSRSGRTIRQFKHEEFDKPSLIACAADKRLYVAERRDVPSNSRGQVHIIDSASSGFEYKSAFGVSGDRDGQLRVVNGLCVLRNGDVVVASDSRLQVFNRDGLFRSRWTRPIVAADSNAAGSPPRSGSGPSEKQRNRQSIAVTSQLVQAVGSGTLGGKDQSKRSSVIFTTGDSRSPNKSKSNTLTHSQTANVSVSRQPTTGTFVSVALDALGQLLAIWKDGPNYSILVFSYDVASGQLELAHTVDACTGDAKRLRRPVAIAGACAPVTCGPTPAELADAAAMERYDVKVEWATRKRPALLHLAYVIDVGDAGNPCVAILRYK